MNQSHQPVSSQMHPTLPIQYETPRNSPNYSLEPQRQTAFTPEQSPPQQYNLYSQKLQKIQRELQEERRLDREKYGKPSSRVLHHHEAYEKNKSWNEANTLSNPMFSRTVREQTLVENSVSQQMLKRNCSMKSIKTRTQKKLVYVPVEKQVIYYPESFRSPAEAREVSIAHLQSKGLMVKKDAQFKTMKHDLIYDYANKEARLGSSMIGYREGSFYRPLSNHAEIPFQGRDYQVQGSRYREERECQSPIHALKRADNIGNSRSMPIIPIDYSPIQRGSGRIQQLAEVPEERQDHRVSQMIQNKNPYIRIETPQIPKSFFEKHQDFQYSFQNPEHGYMQR